MARLGDPADLRLVVRFLRSLPDWTQEVLSRASGVDRGLISDYELGLKAPTRKTLERLASAVRLPFSYVEALIPLFRAARLAQEGGSSGQTAPGGFPESVAAGLDQAILDAVLPRIHPHLLELETLMAGGPEISTFEARREAGEIWETLRPLSLYRRRAAVEREPRYWTWAVAERLCEESSKAAADRADLAMELANLAVRAAELSSGSEAWRWQIQGYAWAFVGNARRVGGDLAGAEEAFERSDRLWEAGAAAGPGVLGGSRLLDLKASLRRYQNRFREALALLDRALEAAGSAEARARLLVNKANTLELMDDSESALRELQQARSLVEGSQDTRLLALVGFGLAVNLAQLGRFKEAEDLLPGLRRLTADKELDRIRFLWLMGRVNAGLERREEALYALEEVQRYFTAEEIAYDAALASLELAILHLEAGGTGEVERLVEEMLWIFKAQGVHKEALAALKLFCDASIHGEATPALAREVFDYLNKARNRPEMRFERAQNELR